MKRRRRLRDGERTPAEQAKLGERVFFVAAILALPALWLLVKIRNK